MTNHSKVRNPFTSPDTPTFADLIVRIDGDRGLNCSKKRQVSSALRKVADWIDKLPHEVPASATYLRRALTNFHPQQAGVTRKRVQNATSDVKFAMRHCGVVLNEATYLAALTPEWQALWDLLDGLKYYRSGLSRFMRFVSAQRITPEDVTQATFDAFLLAVEAEAITKNPRTQHQTACRLWNKCATTIQGWPQACIEVPRYRQTYTLKLEEFPESFQVDVEAYLARLAHADLFDLSGPKRALRPKTIACRRMHIRQLGSALIHDGMDVEDITALAVIVEHYEAALKWLVNRNGGETSGMIAGIAACLLAIAKYHVKAKPEHLDALARLTSNLTPELRGLTPKNRNRLQQFDDGRKVRLLLWFGRGEFARIRKADNGKRLSAVQASIALAVEILLHAPMRISNLAGLSLDRHLRWEKAGRQGCLAISIDGSEVKNRVDLHCVLPNDVSEMVRQYLVTFRPRLVTSDNGYLFPGRGDQPKRSDTLSKQIKRALWQHRRLEVNPHLIRHIVAKITVETTPGNYEDAARLLGHRTTNTTYVHYEGSEQKIANAHFHEVLMEQRGFTNPAPRSGRALRRNTSRRRK